MELTNEFRVGAPIERAYAVLTDVELIAPCLPGAQLQEVEGEEYRGVVKVKVGPITAQYKGAATFVERVSPTRVVLRAEGRETRGQGSAAATITATLTADGDATLVTVVTDLTITGKVAQFGRGVLADVSSKLLGQFVDCLEGKVLASPSEGSAPTTPASASGGASSAAQGNGSGTTADGAAGATAVAVAEPADGEPADPAVATAGAPGGVRRISSPEPEPVDLMAAAGSPVAKRIAVPAAIVAVAWLLRVLLRRRR
ncbi:MAG: SRPBCC family protein [Acidimicrobiia bacterium]|nr:SRPBCC family protein [Acidimicrobiia bacterium]